MLKPASTKNLLLLISVLALSSFTAWGRPNLKPEWIRKSPTDWAPNISRMSPAEEIKKEPVLTDGLLNGADTHRFKSQYERMSNDYEKKREANRLDYHAQSAQMGQMKELSKEVVKTIRLKQRDKSTARLKNVVTSIDAIKKPLAVAVAVLAYSSGRPIEARLSEQTRLWGFSNIPHGVTHLELRSPIARTAFTYSGMSSGAADFFPGVPEWVSRDERYRFALSRDLPYLNVGAGVIYGASTHTVTASLARPIAPHLTAEVSSRMPMSSSSTIVTSEEMLKLSYQVLF